MTSYRVYCFDGSGRITTAHWIDAESDDEALHLARTGEFGVRCEVWDRDRLIGSLESYGGGAPEPA